MRDEPLMRVPFFVSIPAAAFCWNPAPELIGSPSPPFAARNARWIISPRDSPSTKLIVSTFFVDKLSIALGVVISGHLPSIALPITVNMLASRVKSNSNGTWVRYSFKIEVWSKGSLIPLLSANSLTASMFFMSMAISFSLPGTWTFTATFVFPSFRVATCTCAMVAVASGDFSKLANNLSTLPFNSFWTIFLMTFPSTGGQSSNTDFSAAMYCGGSKSLFVANTCPTFK